MSLIEGTNHSRYKNGVEGVNSSTDHEHACKPSCLIRRPNADGVSNDNQKRRVNEARSTSVIAIGYECRDTCCDGSQHIHWD
jgi:hypothetical protein